MLAITMRVCRADYPNDNFELRDCLASDWPRFLRRLLPGKPWIMLPNIGAEITAYIDKFCISSLIFSGGEDWGLFPARDETEGALFRHAADRQILGVCRGAQIINQFLGGSASPQASHAACRHKIRLDKRIAKVEECLVNSYHRLGIRPEDLAPGLVPFAWSCDGYIEGFISVDGRICGIMWHPEREKDADCLDSFLQRHLTKEL